MKRILIPLLITIGCSDFATEPTTEVEQPITTTTQDTTSFAVAGDFWLLVTQMWYDIEYAETITANVVVWFSIGYTGTESTTASITLESLLFRLSEDGNIGEHLEIMRTTVEPPNGDWFTGEVVWALSHVSQNVYDIEDERGYAVVHRLLVGGGVGKLIILEEL